jgi:precorrin-2 methylase
LLASPQAERDASRRPSAAQEGFQADEEEAARAWEDVDSVVLLHISDARSRAHKAADTCAQDGTEAHIVAALTDAEQQLAELHRKLSQGTYYAVPDKSLKLAV